MKVFEFESIPESYSEILKYVLENGSEVSPRGILTKEITPVTIVINNPRKRLISHPKRKINYGFAVGELFWILQGKNDLSITHYNKQWGNFTDNGEILNGAYGQRIFNWDAGEDFVESNKEHDGVPVFEIQQIKVNQFIEVARKLKEDPHSRQGTIMIFDPSRDFLPTKDVPCTNLMRFSIRDNKLNMMVVMRSNDLIKGYVYDVFNFTMLQEMMAGLLDVEVGKYTHVVDSIHLYESDFELAKDIIISPDENIYDNFELIDARNFSDEDLSYSFNIEQLTRETGQEISVEQVIEELEKIKNKYFQSLAAVIATYNFRKYKRNQDELDSLKNYITNEFSKIEVIKNWKTLN